MVVPQISCWLAAILLNVQDGAEVARAVQTAYEANRAALHRFGEMEFQLSIGTAADADAALHDEWTTRYDAKGYYAFNDDHARYEYVFPLETMTAARQTAAVMNGRVPFPRSGCSPMAR